MIRTILLYCLGTILLLLGLVGLLMPLLPGVVFLVAAAFCFAAQSPRLQARFERHPAWRGFQRRWQASRGMPALRRARLAAWLTAEATLNTLRGR